MCNYKESNIVPWVDDLKRYAKAFYNEIISLDEEFKTIVKYDEGMFEKIFYKYNVYRTGFHDLIKGDLIDRHKILAALLLAATDRKNLIFKVDYEAIERSSRNDFPYWVLHPNEYYLSTMLLRILTNYVLTTEKSKKHGLDNGSYDIRFPDTVIWWEQNVIESYKEQFCLLLSTLIRIDDVTIKCSLLASHLIYFYEVAYDCAVMELTKLHYNMEA